MLTDNCFPNEIGGSKRKPLQSTGSSFNNIKDRKRNPSKERKPFEESGSSSNTASVSNPHLSECKRGNIEQVCNFLSFPFLSFPFLLIPQFSPLKACSLSFFLSKGIRRKERLPILLDLSPPSSLLSPLSSLLFPLSSFLSSLSFFRLALLLFPLLYLSLLAFSSTFLRIGCTLPKRKKQRRLVKEERNKLVKQKSKEGGSKER